MYLDVHCLHVYDNTDGHMTNIHHVFVLMYLLFVQFSVEDNPKKYNNEIEDIDECDIHKVISMLVHDIVSEFHSN